MEESARVDSGVAMSLTPELQCTTLYQQSDGDAFIAAIQVAVAAQIGAMFDGVASIVLKDAPLFAEDDASDQAFFFAAQQGDAKRAAQRTTFAR